jgi:hypothetical protein
MTLRVERERFLKEFDKAVKTYKKERAATPKKRRKRKGVSARPTTKIGKRHS